MVFVILGIAVFYFLYSRQQDDANQQGGGGNDTPPPKPNTQIASIEDAARKGGEALAALYKDMLGLNDRRFRDAPTIAALMGPIMGAIAAGVAAALVGGSIAIGTLGIWAFPVAVALFAIFDVAATIESEIRRGQLDEMQRHADALFRDRQYMACLSYVIEKRLDGAKLNDAGEITEGGWPVCMLKVVNPPFPRPGDYTVFGDSPMIPLADKDGLPTGQSVNAGDLLNYAYDEPIKAFLKVRPWSTNWNDDDRLVWQMENAKLFAGGDMIAKLVCRAFPWFEPNAFQWRPVWPASRSVLVANVNSDEPIDTSVRVIGGTGTTIVGQLGNTYVTGGTVVFVDDTVEPEGGGGKAIDTTSTSGNTGANDGGDEIEGSTRTGGHTPANHSGSGGRNG